MTNTSFDWSAIREQIIEATGATPYPQQEQAIIDVFHRHPADVVQAAARTLSRFERGKIHTSASVWPFLKTDVEKIDQVLSGNLTVTSAPDRDLKVRHARQYMIRQAYIVDRWSEMEDILFGRGGMLEPWSDDEALKNELHGFFETDVKTIPYPEPLVWIPRNPKKYNEPHIP